MKTYRKCTLICCFILLFALFTALPASAAVSPRSGGVSSHITCSGVPGRSLNVYGDEVYGNFGTVNMWTTLNVPAQSWKLEYYDDNNNFYIVSRGNPQYVLTVDRRTASNWNCVIYLASQDTVDSRIHAKNVSNYNTGDMAVQLSLVTYPSHVLRAAGTGNGARVDWNGSGVTSDPYQRWQGVGQYT